MGLVWNVEGRATGNITQKQYGELPDKSHPCNSVGCRHNPSDTEELTLISSSAERNEHGVEFRRFPLRRRRLNRTSVRLIDDPVNPLKPSGYFTGGLISP